MSKLELENGNFLLKSACLKVTSLAWKDSLKKSAATKFFELNLFLVRKLKTLLERWPAPAPRSRILDSFEIEELTSSNTLSLVVFLWEAEGIFVI